MHPIGDRQVGWEQVRPVWKPVAHVCSGGLTLSVVHLTGAVQAW
jgi:hypothetical protein